MAIQCATCKKISIQSHFTFLTVVHWLELLQIDDFSLDSEHQQEISKHLQNSDSNVPNSSKQGMGFELRPLFYQAEAWKCFEDILKNGIVSSLLSFFCY